MDEIDALNRLLSGHCSREGVRLVDAHGHMQDPGRPGYLDPRWDNGDGAHLNGEGYRRLGMFVASAISDLVVTGTDGAFRILCLGDSITEGYPGHINGREGNRWEPYTALLEAPGVAVTNLGQSGDTTDGMLRRLVIHLGRDGPAPDMCIVLGGTNDLFLGIPPEAVAGTLGRILALCRTRGIVPVAVTVLPVTV